MMICKADFEELFPEIFASGLRNGPKTTAHQSNAECLVRWEDDGGRMDTVLAPSDRDRQHTARVANHWPVPMHIAAQWAMAPRLVVLAVVLCGLAFAHRIDGNLSGSLETRV